MIDKKRSYAEFRPFYSVDSNVNINAGMVAFLATNAAGVTVATTAASGTVPIGTFWKDRNSSWQRTTVESQTFNASDIITLSGGNVLSTASVKVTNAAGTTTYTQSTDYTVNTTNGVITRVGGGSIAASATVVVWYSYSLSATQVQWAMSSTQWSSGVNYDRQADDTLGSGKIAVVEGNSKIFTDQYDPSVAYTMNAALYADTSSRWTTTAGTTSACGRVIKVPTAADPFLGVDQVRVLA